MAGGSQAPLKVLFLASEAEPFYKVGGLGDYAGSLPAALRAVAEKEGLPLDIRVALPFHQSIAVDPGGFKKIARLTVPKRRGTAKGVAFQTTFNDIPYYFIRRSGKAGGFERIYSPDPLQDARKYIFYSLASLRLAEALDWQPDILHANDWHAAVAVHQLKRLAPDHPFFRNTHSLLVVHNLPYMGGGTEDVLNEFGLSPVDAEGLPAWGRHFPLTMGLVSADHIAAVSPSYAQELLTEEFGSGLVKFFESRRDRLSGILNGIDTRLWDPRTDSHIPENYSADSLERKPLNKAAVLNALDLPADKERPLLVAITRLDVQKGVDLILSVMPSLKDLPWDLAVLGSGSPGYERDFRDLQEAFPGRVRVSLEFNSHLAHQLYAAGDIFLMPSRYEPCGLSQMIAMRYGCLPVARAVGGLRDTIQDALPDARTGYLFPDADEVSFERALRSAIGDFGNRKAWQAAQVRAMRQDFSWEQSARRYLDLYRELSTEGK